MGVGIARTIERGIDRLQHAVHVVREIIVPDTDDAIAFRFQPARPSLVGYFVCLGGMLRAVKFDDQTRGHAGEIRDKRPDRHLPAEMRPLGFNRAKALPQQQFRIGRLRAKPARMGAAESVDW
jgi:hypothetical protein